MTHSTEIAQTISIQAIGFIAAQEDILNQLLGSSGLALADLKTGLQNPEILAAVLDWLLQNEKILLLFCEEFEVIPDLIWRSRNQLPGAPTQDYQSV